MSELLSGILSGLLWFGAIAGLLFGGWLWWRLMKNPQLNNRVLAGMWIMFLLFLVVAIVRGGGPVALKYIPPPIQESWLEHYHAISFQSPLKKLRLEREQAIQAAKNQPVGTWFWWWLCGGTFLLALISTPIASWDEIQKAYFGVVDAQQLRRQRFIFGQNPNEAPASGPAMANAAVESETRRVWRLIKAFLPLEIFSEIFGDFFRRLFRRGHN